VDEVFERYKVTFQKALGAHILATLPLLVQLNTHHVCTNGEWHCLHRRPLARSLPRLPLSARGRLPAFATPDPA
jgi:hypothetical protein